MTDFFVALLNRALSASYLILAVLLLRLILRKTPKNLLLWLWALVGLRLVLPDAPVSPLSLVPQGQIIPSDIALSPAPVIPSQIAPIDPTVNPALAQNAAPIPAPSANPMQVALTVAAILWAVGAVALVLYAAFRYGRIWRRVQASIPLGDRQYLCDGIPTAFLLGLFRPRIYLPSNMAEENRAYVLRHELAHLRHGDQLWKPLGFAMVCLYWFHPLVWLSYWLFCRDLEMACDERVIAQLGEGEKKAYSYALLACSAQRQGLHLSPLAFGESSVRSRIRNVLRFRKAGVWMILLVLVLGAAATVFFLTDPSQPPEETMPPETIQTEPAETTQPETLPTEAPTEPTVPTEPIPEDLTFRPHQKDKAYPYQFEDLQMDVTNVLAVAQTTATDANGETYQQTYLLTAPGTQTLVDTYQADNWMLIQGNQPQNWAFSSETGRYALAHNNYSLRQLSTGRTPLHLLRGSRFENGTPPTAASALVWDADTNQLLYDYHSDQKIPTGRLNRLALALAVVQEREAQDLVSVSTIPARLRSPDTAFYPTILMEGTGTETYMADQPMTVEQLLTVLLLKSGQDASYALAIHTAGSEAAMVAKMNAVAQRYCTQTNYTDLYGNAEGQYTTAADTLRLVQALLAEPCLRSIWSCRSMTLDLPGEEKDPVVYTQNYLMDNITLPLFYDTRVTGGVVSSRLQDGGSFDSICTASDSGRDVICIVMGAKRVMDENKSWVVRYYGNHEEMLGLLNTVLGGY